jgi:hypothetical protein
MPVDSSSDDKILGSCEIRNFSYVEEDCVPVMLFNFKF